MLVTWVTTVGLGLAEGASDGAMEGSVEGADDGAVVGDPGLGNVGLRADEQHATLPVGADGRSPENAVQVVRTGAAGRTTCRGSPSTTTNTVRSTSWRRTTSDSAPAKAATSRAPETANVCGVL